MEDKMMMDELKTAVASEMGDLVITAVRAALQHSGLGVVAKLWKGGFRTRIYLGSTAGFVEIGEDLKMTVEDSGELTDQLQAVVDEAESKAMSYVMEAVLGDPAELLHEAQAAYKAARQARAASSDDAERAELREQMRGLHERCQLLSSVKACAHRIDPELVAAARAERDEAAATSVDSVSSFDEAEAEAEARAAAPLTEDELFELDDEELAVKAAALQAAAVEAPESLEAPAESFGSLEPEAAATLEPLPAPVLEPLEAPVSTEARAELAVRTARFARRAASRCAETADRYNDIITTHGSRGGAMNTTTKNATASPELQAALARTQAAVEAIPEDRPLTREQVAAVVEARCVEALSFEAEAHSLPAALRAAMLEPGEHEVSLEALAEGLKAVEAASRELCEGSLAAASEDYGHAQRRLECAGLLGAFAWAPRFAGELSRWCALAAGKTACEGRAEELPADPFYDGERRLLDGVGPVCLSDGWLWPVEV